MSTLISQLDLLTGVLFWLLKESVTVSMVSKIILMPRTQPPFLTFHDIVRVSVLTLLQRSLPGLILDSM